MLGALWQYRHTFRDSPHFAVIRLPRKLIPSATVTAGAASADITVYLDSLPIGTTIWSNPGNGSGVSKIVPAVPSATGVADVFAFQGDGTVQAITAGPGRKERSGLRPEPESLSRG